MDHRIDASLPPPLPGAAARMHSHLPQSGYGITSFVIGSLAVVCTLFFAMLANILAGDADRNVVVVVFALFLAFASDGSPGGMVFVFVLLMLPIIAVPLTGLFFGMAGLRQSGRKKRLAWFGACFNASALLAVILFFLIGVTSH